MPRILSIGPDGYLRQRPAPEFDSLRGTLKNFPATGTGKTFRARTDVAMDAAEIEAEFTGNGTFGLELRRSSAGKAGVTVSIRARLS